MDPTKEAQASQLALDANLTTLADELGARGRDLVETLEQRKREKELITSLGLAPEPSEPLKTDNTEPDDAEQKAETAASEG